MAATARRVSAEYLALAKRYSASTEDHNHSLSVITEHFHDCVASIRDRDENVMTFDPMKISGARLVELLETALAEAGRKLQ